MKRHLLLLLCLFILFESSAQLTLTLQVPPSGVLLKPQLWNAVITNSYANAKQIYLGLSLSDASTGEPIMTATTSQLTLDPGALQATDYNLSPINYEYLSSRIIDIAPDGYLSAGSFTACYTLFIVNEGSGTPVIEQCIPVTVEPVSPPILNTPYNEEIIQTHYPQFTWIPPTPAGIFSNLNYDFILVEEQQGQTAIDAIQQNLPIYSNNQTDFYLNYPLSGAALDTGKTYVWKVIAKNDNSYAAESAVWEFKIQGDSIVHVISGDPLPYVKLQRTLDATISDCEQILKFVYINNSKDDTTISYTISSLEQASLNTVMKAGALPIHGVENYLSVQLLDDNSFVDGNHYLLVVSNSRQEQWKVKFIYHNSKN